MKKTTRTSPLSMHHEGHIMHVGFHFIMKESTRALPKTTTMHHEGKLSRGGFLYSTRTSAFPETTLHNEGNLTHAISPSITSINTLP